jgi:hypothetical protein
MNEFEQFLQDEAEHAEVNKDAPLTPQTRVSRPGGQRARVYSIRLTESEVAALEAAAERAGVPASTLARAWIAERLAEDDGSTDLQSIANTLDILSRRLSAL